MKIYLDVDSDILPKARYAVEVLADVAGLGAEFVCDQDQAQVVYSENGDLQRDMAAGWGRPVHLTEHDIVYNTYALLTGILERDMARDPWGARIAQGSVSHRTGRLGTAPVMWYAKTLREIAGSNGFAPLWPKGKEFAVVLSHDVDVPYRAPHPRYTQGFLRRWLNKVRHRLPNPNLGFRYWQEADLSLATVPTFYISARDRLAPGADPADVEYRITDPRLQKTIRTTIRGGAEVGLHISINAKNLGTSVLVAEKTALEEAAGLPEYAHGYVRGCRHHYWALDPDVPERTLKLHQAAGFKYDSSLGLNDAPGFRRGIACPFHPFLDGERLELLEIAPTLMDGAIFSEPITPEEGRRQIEDHLKYVESVGGAAVLDWHIRTANPKELHGAGKCLREVMEAMADRQDVYWVNPLTLYQWWRRRERAIAGAG